MLLGAIGFEVVQLPSSVAAEGDELPIADTNSGVPFVFPEDRVSLDRFVGERRDEAATFQRLNLLTVELCRTLRCANFRRPDAYVRSGFGSDVGVRTTLGLRDEVPHYEQDNATVVTSSGQFNPSSDSESRWISRSIASWLSRGRAVPASMSFSVLRPLSVALTVVKG